MLLILCNKFVWLHHKYVFLKVDVGGQKFGPYQAQAGHI